MRESRHPVKGDPGTATTGRPACQLAVLLSTILLAACKEPPKLVVVGQSFAAAESVPAGKAIVHFYWPRNKGAGKGRVWVHTPNRFFEIQPGGYATYAAESGENHFDAERLWYYGSMSSLSSRLGSLDLDVEPGHTYFVRLRNEPILVIPHVALQAVAPDTAALEIRACRRLSEMDPTSWYQATKKDAVVKPSRR